jgi:IclR helix-turn-helix domain
MLAMSTTEESSSTQAIAIVLSPTQVDDVVRAAAGGRTPSVSSLVAGALREPGGDTPGGYLPSDTADRRLSRSLFRGLSILACFGSDARERGIVEIARELRMSPSTAHRYALTLVELGLLERCPRTRKYRLPLTASG